MIPGPVYATGNALTLHFRSDANTTKAGWTAVWNNEPFIMNEFDGGDEISLYPNPASEEVRIRRKTQDSRFKMIEIYSISGELVDRLECKSMINVSDLPDGIYLVRILTDKNYITQKLLVTH